MSATSAGLAAPEPAPWLAVAGSSTREDREQLRTLLGWRFETHSRAVARALALQPGLRNSVTGDDQLTGLVAVRVHLAGLGTQVDAALRGRPAGDEQLIDQQIDRVGAELLARCTVSGLRRLPVVVGPVFRPGRPGEAVLAAYRPGQRLVEPGFLEARLDRRRTTGGSVEYAIWSATARRTDRLTGDGPGSEGATRVLFGAGTQFLVLGLEEPTVDTPLRVLLREVPNPAAVSPDPELDERARTRLQATTGLPVAPADHDDDRPDPWAAAPGFGDNAAPFALTA